MNFLIINAWKEGAMSPANLHDDFYNDIIIEALATSKKIQTMIDYPRLLKNYTRQPKLNLK